MAQEALHLFSYWKATLKCYSLLPAYKVTLKETESVFAVVKSTTWIILSWPEVV